MYWLPGIFYRGRGEVYCFANFSTLLDQNFRGQKSLREEGGNSLRGYPLWKKASNLRQTLTVRVTLGWVCFEISRSLKSAEDILLLKISQSDRRSFFEKRIQATWVEPTLLFTSPLRYILPLLWWSTGV